MYKHNYNYYKSDFFKTNEYIVVNTIENSKLLKEFGVSDIDGLENICLIPYLDNDGSFYVFYLKHTKCLQVVTTEEEINKLFQEIKIISQHPYVGSAFMTKVNAFLRFQRMGKRKNHKKKKSKKRSKK